MLTDHTLAHSPNDTFSSNGRNKTVGSPEVRKACQLQLGQLAAHLPLGLAWIVYQTPGRDRCELRLLRTETLPHLNPEILAYLESEVWLQPNLPRLELQLLAIDSLPIYVYLLQEVSNEPCYLLLWSRSWFTPEQIQFVNQQAQLLSYWLSIDRELARQQGEIQLLEQVLQKAEHQLRNPLALISLHAENLRLGLPTGVLQDQAVIIRDTVSDLSSNLTELLHCSQHARLQLTPCNVRSLLRETLDSLHHWLDEKDIKVEMPSQAPVVVVDRWQIKQVLTNLLHNAIHFSPKGATITWEWRVAGQAVYVSIRDRGVGLSVDDLRQAFTPYYSRRPGGTGMGLAIVHKIILDHRGSCWANNHPEGGAQFYFSLPIRQA